MKKIKLKTREIKKKDAQKITFLFLFCCFFFFFFFFVLFFFLCVCVLCVCVCGGGGEGGGGLLYMIRVYNFLNKKADEIRVFIKLYRTNFMGFLKN